MRHTYKMAEKTIIFRKDQVMSMSKVLNMYFYLASQNLTIVFV